MELLLSILSIIFSILSIVFSTLSDVFSIVSNVFSFLSESFSSPILERAEKEVMEESGSFILDSNEDKCLSEDSYESSDLDEYFDIEDVASQNEDDIFNCLPKEVWRIIINSKPMMTSDMKKFRLVSRKADELATEYFDRWSIIFPHNNVDLEVMEVMENIFDLRVTQATISSLPSLPFRPSGVIFKFPNLLTNLEITKPYHERRVSPENLHILLQYKNLKSLELTVPDWHETQPMFVGYDFSNLETLRIIFHSWDSTPYDHVVGNLLQRILRSSTFGKLKCFQMSLFINEERDAELVHKVNNELLEFLIKHGDTLREVTSFMGSDLDDIHGFPSFFEPSRLQNCSKLVSLEVEYDAICYFWDYWVTLLKFQTNLVNLKLNRCISTNTLRTVIRNNYQTLRSIQLCLFEADTVLVDDIEIQQLDFAMFANCENLKKLKLITWDRVSIASINLSLLPSKLELLVVESDSIKISTEDLLMFSSNRIELKWIGYLDMNDLNVFSSFMRLPKILKITWKITPESRTVLKVFCANLRSNHDYVTLNRDKISSVWSYSFTEYHCYLHDE